MELRQNTNLNCTLLIGHELNRLDVYEQSSEGLPLSQDLLLPTDYGVAAAHVLPDLGEGLRALVHVCGQRGNPVEIGELQFALTNTVRHAESLYPVISTGWQDLASNPLISNQADEQDAGQSSFHGFQQKDVLIEVRFDTDSLVVSLWLPKIEKSPTTMYYWVKLQLDGEAYQRIMQSPTQLNSVLSELPEDKVTLHLVDWDGAKPSFLVKLHG
jgi:hypothetical protein